VPAPAVGEARTLVLVRHGETDWNAASRAQGYTDIPLNATGHDQARALADALKALGPVRLWSSDLMRARQTAEYVATATGLPVEQDVRLREYDVGARAGLTIAGFAERFPEEHAAWLTHSEHLLVPGAETTAQVRDRLLPALRECVCALKPRETGIVVLHGGCLTIGLMGLLGWPHELDSSLQGLENGCYCVLTESGRLGGLRLTSYNEKAGGPRHRPELVADAPVG
jgi:glucosyl-3-phosphoglycerate phosphatase